MPPLAARRSPAINLVIVALWLVAAAGFAVMTACASVLSYFPGDLWVSHRLQSIHSGFFDKTVSLPEALANLPLVLVVWVPAVCLLWLLRQRMEAQLLAIAPLGWVLNRIVKEIAMRPRPSHDLARVQDTATDPSFPSGHVITAVLIFGLLLYYATVLVKRPLLRVILQLGCLYGTIFTGLARIYHGDHWLSDVYGAVYLGVLVLAALIAAHHWILATAGKPRPTARSGS